MSDLLYTVGLDATDLETAATAIEQRLEKSGVRIAEQPTKYARASASAFEAIYAGEDKLAQFRAKVAFERMTDEQKLALLRSQAAGMLEQLSGMEDRSAEKASLQLEFEKKKSEIFTINQQLLSAATAETAAQSVEVEKQPGLLGKVSEATQSIKEGFKALGVSIKGIGIGIVVAEVISLGKEAIANAQKIRDEFRALNKEIPSSVSSMANLGDALGGVKTAAVGAVGFLIGGYTQLGELIGSTINRMRGITEEMEKHGELSERAADAADARLAKLREEQHDVDAIAAARRDLAAFEKQAAFDRLNDTEKLNALLMEDVRLREMIQNTEEGTVLFYERKKALAENTQKIHEQGLKISKQEAETEERIVKALADFFGPLDTIAASKEEILAITTAQVTEEAAVTVELENQVAAVERLAEAEEDAAQARAARTRTIDRVGTPYEGQSTAALEGVVGRLQDQIYDLERGRSGRISFENPLGYSFEQQYLEAERARAQNELDQRLAVQQLVKWRGEDAARALYGDEITDRGLRDLQAVQERQAKDIQSIAGILKKMGG